MGLHRRIQTLGRGTVCYTCSLPDVQQTAVVVAAVEETQHEGQRIVRVLFRGSRSIVLLLAWFPVLHVSDMGLEEDSSHEVLAERVDEDEWVCD